MKKTLKSIQKKYGMLNEGYAWERTPGKALPTLEDVQNNYNAKSVNEQQQAPLFKAKGRMIRALRQFEQMLKFVDTEVDRNYGKGNFDSIAITSFKEAERLLYEAASILEEVAPGEG
jgi:hypothetical protein